MRRALGPTAASHSPSVSPSSQPRAWRAKPGEPATSRTRRRSKYAAPSAVRLSGALRGAYGQGMAASRSSGPAPPGAARGPPGRPGGPSEQPLEDRADAVPGHGEGPRGRGRCDGRRRGHRPPYGRGRPGRQAYGTSPAPPGPSARPPASACTIRAAVHSARSTGPSTRRRPRAVRRRVATGGPVARQVASAHSSVVRPRPGSPTRPSTCGPSRDLPPGP